ncbi:MAG: peptidoglycan editing factor PgeF [Clostridia bacterium]|nr:peptidoglycan editing factor PgeF [Clostridia bacterium]
MPFDFYLCEEPVPRYRSRLFDSYGVRHAFFTRRGGVSSGVFESLNFAVGIGFEKDDIKNVIANYAVAASVFGLKETDVCRTYQTHTSVVERATEADRGRGITLPPYDHGVDGLYTTQKDLLLSVRTADCVPVLICDKAKTVCAAVHAGWRGTVGGITLNAIERLNSLGAETRDILVAIGPCIGQCCYEVGGELLPEFTALHPGLAEFFEPRGEKYMLDLTGANRFILERAGVPPEQISCAGFCTKCRPRDFFSHRVSGSDRGTMSAFICL